MSNSSQPIPERLSCPACGGTVPTKQRRSGEKFSCSLCQHAITLVPSTKGGYVLVKTPGAPGASISNPAMSASKSPTVTPAAYSSPVRSAESSTNPSIRPVSAPSNSPSAQANRSTSRAVANSQNPARQMPADMSAAGDVWENGNSNGLSKYLPFFAVGTVGAVALAVIALLFVGRNHQDKNDNNNVVKNDGNVEPVPSPSIPEPAPVPAPAKDNSEPRPAAPPAPPAAPPQPVVLTTADVVKKCEPSVCRIVTSLGSLGTGFVVGKGLIATNEHVIGLTDPTNVTIEFPARHNTRFKVTELAYATPDTDLVVLRIADLPAEYEKLEIEKTSNLQKGEKLIAIGNPGGLTSVVTEGLFGSVQPINGVEFIQLSLAVNPGNSGGPSINAHGRVAGVVTLKDSQEGIGYAIPGDVLKKSLEILDKANSDVVEHNVNRWKCRQVGSKLYYTARLAERLMDEYLKKIIEMAKAKSGTADQAIGIVRIRESDAFEVLAKHMRDADQSCRWFHTANLEKADRQLLTELETSYRTSTGWATKPGGGTVENLAKDSIEVGKKLSELERQVKSSFGMMKLR